MGVYTPSPRSVIPTETFAIAAEHCQKVFGFQDAVACTALMLWNVLVWAAARATSLAHAVDRLYPDTQDQTFWNRLRANLPKQAAALERRLNELLRLPELLPQLVGRHKIEVVRELVKVNHHRNCMMCHAPDGDKMPDSVIAAEVPVPGQPLPTPAQGYRQSSPDLLFRVDVTYLRQDFSVMLPVTEAHPWPEMQRFDFLVRERKVTGDEAAAYCEKLTPKEPGVLSPYHKAALAALRDITGKDTAPTAEAWKTLLNP